MTRRVQLIRHIGATAATFAGLEGEVTVNLTRSSLHVHDGLNAGGYELARADLSNVVDAGVTVGRMTPTQVAQLAQVIADLTTEYTTRNDADVALGGLITALSGSTTSALALKSNLAASPTNGHAAAVDASGNVTDAGFAASSIYRSGGTDVPVTDGGTGRSTITANNLVVGNGNSAVNFVPPNTAGLILASNGPSADPSFQAVEGLSRALPTAWICFNGTGTPAVIGTPFNFSSTITDLGTGKYRVAFSSAKASANYAALVNTNVDGDNQGARNVGSKCVNPTVNGFDIWVRGDTAFVDPTWLSVIVLGP